MADIGTTLREARMRARIDIGEVEARTKIRAKYLRAIENEEWDLLPGPVYVKSFLRTYGDYLGLDSRMLVDEYKRRYERPSDHDPRPIASSRTRERDRRPSGPVLPPWAVIGLVLVAVVAALWVLGKNNGSKTTPPAAPHAKSPRRAHHRPATTTAARSPATPPNVTLQLVPTGRVYVCLVDGNGQRLIPGRIFSPGETIPTETKSKLLLTLGNNAVQMKVNGKPVPVTASPSSIGFTLVPSGAQPLPAAQQPRCA
jgi:cytoskeleton protein RodZ